MNKHGGYHGDDSKMLDFSININPFGMPESVKAKLIAALDNVTVYPEINGESARRKIASDIGVERENLILGNGAIELIYLFARSHQFKRAMILTPTFNEYQRALIMNHCTAIETFLLKPEDEFDIQEETFLQQTESFQPEVIFICNPTNPTGRYYDQKQLERLMAKCSSEIVWFIDESFIEFSDCESCVSMIGNSAPLFILRSMTKIFGMPGIRIGYGIGSPEVIRKMEHWKEPWTINALALTAAENVYDNRDFIQKTRSYIQTERDRVYRALQAIDGIRPFKSAADFHLIQTAIPAEELNRRLNAMSVNVRTCEDFEGLETHYVRAAVKLPEDNDRLINCIRDCMRR